MFFKLCGSICGATREAVSAQSLLLGYLILFVADGALHAGADCGTKRL